MYYLRTSLTGGFSRRSCHRLKAGNRRLLLTGIDRTAGLGFPRAVAATTHYKQLIGCPNNSSNR
jgi:hypothetical protein